MDLSPRSDYTWSTTSLLCVYQGGICRGDMSWSLNLEVLHEMAYFVLMCCGHTIVSPSLTILTNTTLVSS